MQEYFSQREGEQREMRQLVEATMAGHQNTRDAKLKLQQMKQKIGELLQIVLQGVAGSAWLQDLFFWYTHDRLMACLLLPQFSRCPRKARS